MNIEKYPYILDNNIKEKRQKLIKNISVVCFISLCLFVLKNEFNNVNQINDNGSQVRSEEIEDIDNESFKKEEFTELKNAYFLTILKKTENFSKKFYKDNEGIAIAYGWNISKNTAEFNNRISDLLHFNKNQKTLIEKYSGKNIKEIPDVLKTISVNEKYINKSVNYMYEYYLSEFIDVLSTKSKNKEIEEKFIKKFSEEELAVFSHMAYKLGKYKLSKYDNFFNQLIKMVESEKFRKGDFNKLSNEVEYTFKFKGRKYIDENAQKIHRYHLLS